MISKPCNYFLTLTMQWVLEILQVYCEKGLKNKIMGE